MINKKIINIIIYYMEYYEILDSLYSDDINTIKQRFREKIKECHPDKNGGDEEKAKKILNAWNFIKENHNNPENMFKKPSSNMVPLGFRQRGFDYIPTLGEFVRKEIEREQKIKLQNTELPILQDKEPGLLESLYLFLFE